jgi:hypothetical protein
MALAAEKRFTVEGCCASDIKFYTRGIRAEDVR